MWIKKKTWWISKVNVPHNVFVLKKGGQKEEGKRKGIESLHNIL